MYAYLLRDQSVQKVFSQNKISVFDLGAQWNTCPGTGIYKLSV
jgi:hypothetical protein